MCENARRAITPTSMAKACIYNCAQLSSQISDDNKKKKLRDAAMRVLFKTTPFQ